VFGYGIIDLARATLPQIQLDIGIGVAGALTVGNGGSGTIDTTHSNATMVYTNIVEPKARNFDIRVGSGVLASDRLAIELQAVSAYNLGLHTSTMASVADAEAAIHAIDTAIDRVATARAGVGAVLNRLEFASFQIATSYENLESARSALLDLDVSAEMASFLSKQVLAQVGASMSA